MYVARGWNKNATRADGADINKYIMESPPEAADVRNGVITGRLPGTTKTSWFG